MLKSSLQTLKKKILLQLIQNYSLLGHKINKCNPKMGPYLLSLKNGYTIFDLIKTLKLLKLSGSIIKKIKNNKGKILFIGTNNVTFNFNLLEFYAKISNSFYITSRWIGGLLTNWETTKKLIIKLNYLKTFNDSNFKQLTKKQISKYKKELYRLKQLFNGIQNMTELPDLVIFINPNKDLLAIKECLILGIPIIALTDSNCDPTLLPFLIPCNSNSCFSIHLILNYLINQFLF